MSIFTCHAAKNSRPRFCLPSACLLTSSFLEKDDTRRQQPLSLEHAANTAVARTLSPSVSHTLPPSAHNISSVSRYMVVCLTIYRLSHTLYGHLCHTRGCLRHVQTVHLHRVVTPIYIYVCMCIYICIEYETDRDNNDTADGNVAEKHCVSC